MPISADQERQLLNHYKLTNLYPDAWPHRDDGNSSDSDLDEPQPANGGPVGQPRKLSLGGRASMSYRNIDRHASVRSAASLGPDSVVQKDEPDPLGMAPSVVSELRRKGLPVEEDLQLRNRFMLSSTSFSPALFLSQVHQDASTDDLLRGLDFLSRSIEQKSASLKVLVESNFDKFVKAKATIDNVYTEMRTQGADEAPPTSPPPPSAYGAGAGRRSGQHSRHTSRSQTHFRNTSGAFSPTSKPLPSDKKKNAMTKESEYGVLGVKAPLQELAIKAEEVWGPALGGREKEETMKSVLTALDQHREIFRLAGTVTEATKKNDYDTVIISWKSAQKYADQARQLAETAKENDTAIRDQDARQIIVTAKMWHDVSHQLEAFKRETWRRLKDSHGRKPASGLAAGMAEEVDKEEHMELIGVLLQLGVDENPIWEWLHARYLYLRDKIARSFERSRIEIEILRRGLANRANERVDGRTAAQYLRSAATTSSLSKAKDALRDSTADAPEILAFWEKVQACFTQLLATPNGVLGEVLDFWETTQSFIDNKAQKAFPTAVFAAAGLEHLELEPDDVANLRAGTVELITLLRESIMAFFADVPPEDLSDLYSPIPPTPITPADSAGSATLTPSQSRRAFTFDPSSVPPVSPKRGAAWEKFAFWAPGANAVSGSQYLARLLALVGTAASEMASLSVIKQAHNNNNGGGTEALKTLVGAARERCVQALCAAWTADAERCKFLERWQRSSPERRDLTTMPGVFRGFEERVLAGFQRCAYVSEARVSSFSSSSSSSSAGRGGGSGLVGGRGEEVVVPPPAKLLQAVRGSFVTSLYKVLSGMVESAEKGLVLGGREGDEDGVTVAAAVVVGKGRREGAVLLDGGVQVDAGNRNVRMLMTLSNLAHLRADTIPHLIGHFEAAFSVKLTDESKTIRDVLGQIDARLFQSYVRPTVDLLNQTISKGIASPDWAPKDGGRPTDARPYVYDVLLTLVLVHAEVSTTTSTTTVGSAGSVSSPSPLTSQTLSYLLEHASLALLHSFQTHHSGYDLPALMQATLDVEFLAQTLNLYTTDRAGEVQSQIYLALDERTDDEARKRLQGELPEMRAVLKRLREGTKGGLGCFRRERRGREGAGKTSGGGGRGS